MATALQVHSIRLSVSIEQEIRMLLSLGILFLRVLLYYHLSGLWKLGKRFCIYIKYMYKYKHYTYIAD